MIYLSGAYRKDLPIVSDLGLMLTPMLGYKSDLTATWTWGADTGCFAAPKKHDDEKYLAWLDKRNRDTNLFATAPDVVGDAKATWERSAAMLPRIRALGYKAALVAQDGIEETEVDWGAFDCLFVGGSTDWKLSESAYAIVREAKRHGLWCHMGRVNSLKRVKAATVGGYDSVDGTCIAFGPSKRIPDVISWMDQVNRQPTLLPMI